MLLGAFRGGNPLERIVGVPSLWPRPGGVLQQHGLGVFRQLTEDTDRSQWVNKRIALDRKSTRLNSPTCFRYSRRSVLMAATWWSSSTARVGRFSATYRRHGSISMGQ